MVKCIICGENAIYRIKGTNDFYCKECAIENFSDISVLENIEIQPICNKDIEKEIDQTVERLLDEDFIDNDIPKDHSDDDFDIFEFNSDEKKEE
ncbi:MAG: hypothetical protein PHY80_06785 [Rickettsiales bacterium]|nr:hypothetical protein [Rickettsiales bacterium]